MGSASVCYNTTNRFVCASMYPEFAHNMNRFVYAGMYLNEATGDSLVPSPPNHMAVLACSGCIVGGLRTRYRVFTILQHRAMLSVASQLASA